MVARYSFTARIGGCTRVHGRARIGAGSILAAGTLIPEGMVIEPRSLVMGMPGKVRRQLGDDDQEMILKYARNYLGYREQYLKERSG